MAEQDTAKRGQAVEMSPEDDIIPQASQSPRGAILEADLQAHIGRQLRAVYDEVVNEAVPDRFLRLLEELDRKKSGGA